MGEKEDKPGLYLSICSRHTSQQLPCCYSDRKRNHQQPRLASVLEDGICRFSSRRNFVNELREDWTATLLPVRGFSAKPLAGNWLAVWLRYHTHGLVWYGCLCRMESVCGCLSLEAHLRRLHDLWLSYTPEHATIVKCMFTTVIGHTLHYTE